MPGTMPDKIQCLQKQINLIKQEISNWPVSIAFNSMILVKERLNAITDNPILG